MSDTEPHAWGMGLINDITYVGLDVHKATVCIAVSESGRGGEVCQVGVFGNPRMRACSTGVFGLCLLPCAPACSIAFRSCRRRESASELLTANMRAGR